MRVLHVISSLDPRSGGPAEALRGLTTAQAAAGLSVSVAATYKADAQLGFAEQMKEKGVMVRLIGPCRGPLTRHRDLAGIMAETIQEAEIVHIHGLWEEIQHKAARHAYRLGKPYLIRPCGMLDPWSLAQGRLKKALYLRWRLRTNLNRAAALHFTSQPERDLTRSLRLHAPCLIEPNGIDLDEFAHLPARGAFRSRYGIASERPVVLFMSRLHPKKGLDLLLPAFARLAEEAPLLVIAGPDLDDYRADLERDVIRLGLQDRVLFTGMLYGVDKLAAFVDADLFVLPSYQENFGIAVVEALAAGTPVVISDQVNIHAEVEAAGVGGVVATNVNALANELRRWLNDNPLRRMATEKARPFVRDRFSWDQIAQRWVKHYSDLLRSDPSADRG
ncbi:MAG: glycosyltransferase [Gemmataceae bacterium]